MSFHISRIMHASYKTLSEMLNAEFIFKRLRNMGNRWEECRIMSNLFPRWYNVHVRCDYHFGNSGHPTKNCTALKHKVRDLINDGKLKFEDLDIPAHVKDLSKAKVEMARQKHGTLREASLRKVAMPK